MPARLVLWIALFFAYEVAAAANADEPAPVPPQSAQPKSNKPRAALKPPAQADPRLEHILAEWERAASGIRRRDCTFARFKYDSVFDVERRGMGSLAIDDEGRAAYRIMPVQIAAGQVSRRLDRGGVPYKLEPDDCQRWHWTGKCLIQVDENERTYQEFAFPPEREESSVAPVDPVNDGFQPDPPALPEDERQPAKFPQAIDEPSDNDLSLCKSEKRLSDQPEPASKEKAPTLNEWFADLVFGIALGYALSQIDEAKWLEARSQYPLPRAFLLGTRAGELKQQFRIKLLKENETEAWLQFESRRGNGSFSRAILILSTRDYKPVAIKLSDAIGGETVYLFSDVKNHSRGEVLPPPLDRPDLTGYRQITNNGQ